MSVQQTHTHTKVWLGIADTQRVRQNCSNSLTDNVWAMCINPPPPSPKKQTAVLIFLLMTSKVTNPLKLDSNSSVKMMHLNEADTTNLTRSDKMSIQG